MCRLYFRTKILIICIFCASMFPLHSPNWMLFLFHTSRHPSAPPLLSCEWLSFSAPPYVRTPVCVFGSLTDLLRPTPSSLNSTLPKSPFWLFAVKFLIILIFWLYKTLFHKPPPLTQVHLNACCTEVSRVYPPSPSHPPPIPILAPFLFMIL